MKTEETHLQPSKELSQFFADRREEAPLLATTDIETLLSERVMLPPATDHTLRRLIMSIAGLAGIVAVTYYLLPGHHNIQSQRAERLNSPSETRSLPQSSEKTRGTPNTAIRSSVASFPSTKEVARGPWSAPGNQIYADLTPEELAKLGVEVRDDDTIIYYDQSTSPAIAYDKPGGHAIIDHDTPTKVHLDRMLLAPKYSSLSQIDSNSIPIHIGIPHYFPVLITSGDGGSAEYRYDEGNNSGFGSLGEEQEITRWRDWLKKPGIPGYRAFAYSTTSVRSTNKDDSTKTDEIDTVKISIGHDLPERPFPARAPKLKAISDSSHKAAFLQLLHYYDGSGPKPNIEWPSYLAITVDTVTVRDIEMQMDDRENSEVLRKARSIFRRIGELVPVIVRKSGRGQPGPNDKIFWYEPSDELFNALPVKQAIMLRSKKAPQCMNAPTAVVSSAEVTYCVEQPQEVLVRVIDLTGHVVMSMHQHAESGDNIANVNTESLPSGMYIISVQNNDGTQRTRRIWVQNAHPKQ